LRSSVLQDVITAAINERLEPVKAMIVLSSGNPDAAQAVPQPCQVVVVVTRQRLLEPQDIQLPELARNGESTLKPPFHMPGEARLDSCLIGIHHDLDLVGNGGTDGLDDFDVVAGICAVKAQLQGAKALGEHAMDIIDPLGGRTDFGCCAISSHPVGITAPQFVDLQVGELA